jgi:peroxiredoxin
MRRRQTCLMTTVMVTIGLLMLGQTATATDQLLGAMGMAKLPGKAAPNFMLLDVSRKQVSLQEYRGKAVFLNFWATWCIPCREEMPAMEQLHQPFQGQGLTILAVNLKESAEQVKSFFDKHRFSFPALLDHSGAVSRAYGVMGLPTTYLISREGMLMAQGIGGRDWTRAEGHALIRELLTTVRAESGPKISVEGRE